MQQGAGHKPYRERLRVDQAFYLELDFCNEAGIAHSAFLAWDPADRAKALAFRLHKGQLCPLCGTAPWEWEPCQGGRRFAYEPIERYCHGCYLKAVGGEGSPASPGITIDLAPTGTPEAARRYVAARAAHERRERS